MKQLLGFGCCLGSVDLIVSISSENIYPSKSFKILLEQSPGRLNILWYCPLPYSENKTEIQRVCDLFSAASTVVEETAMPCQQTGGQKFTLNSVLGSEMDS